MRRNSSSLFLLRQATQNSNNWRRVLGETQDAWAWHPSDKITKIIRRNWPNHPSQKSINYIGAKNHPLLTSVPQNVFVHSLDISSLPSPKFWLSLPRWAGALRQQGEKGATPKLVVFPPAEIFSLWGSPKVNVMVYVRRIQKEQHFSVSFCFFFVTPRSRTVSARIFMWNWKRNICPIGVRLWPVCTRSLWNCTISFIRLLGFASSVLQNVGWYWQAGKPVFKTVFYFFVISVALLLSTGFLAQFTHDKMNCSRSTCTWLNVKNHPWIRDNYQADQNYHISHLFSYGICDFCRCFIAKASRFLFITSATSIKQRVTDQFCSLRLGNHMKPPRG